MANYLKLGQKFAGVIRGGAIQATGDTTEAAGNRVFQKKLSAIDRIARSQERIAVKKPEIGSRKEAQSRRDTYECKKTEYAGVYHDEYKSAIADNPELIDLNQRELKNHLSDYGLPKPKEQVAPKSSNRRILEARMNSGISRRYQIKNEQQQLNAAVDAIKSEVGRAEIGKRYGIKGHEGMPANEMTEAVYGHHAKRLEQGPSSIDNIYSNDSHKIAAGSALVTSRVVAALNNNRGQQTNAQLYGQAPRPGM